MYLIDDFLLHLKNIAINKRNGILSVKCPASERKFFFKNGVMIALTTSVSEEKIGTILISMGKAKREYIDKAVILNEKVGKFLVKEGIITPDELFGALNFQTKKIISVISNVKEKCTIEFEPTSNNLPQKSVNFDFKTILTFLIFYVNITTIDVSKEDEFAIPKIKDANFLNELIPNAVKSIVQLVDGEKTHSEILKLSNFPKIEYFKLMYFLKVLGIVEEVEPKIQIAPELEREIEKYFNLAREKKYTEIFKEKNDLEALKREYFKLSKKFHPDRVGRDIPPEVKEKIEIIFDAINKGYEILTDPEKRQEFLEEKLEEEAFNPKEFAKQSFERAKVLYRNGMYREAISLLESAVRYDKENAEYLLLLGIVQMKTAGYKKEAEENLKKVIKLSPWNSEAYYFLGKLYLEEGLINKAKSIFEKAHRQFPQHERIKQEYSKLFKEKKSIFNIFKK